MSTLSINHRTGKIVSSFPIARFNQPTSSQPASIFSVHEKLGEGSFAKVYRCSDPRYSSSCAVKCYTPDKGAREEGRREIHNLRLLTQAQAPHVVQYFGYLKETDSRGPAIVEEFIATGDLSRHYHQFSLLKILTTAKQVLEALAYFHKLHLIYCDLKFENTLYETDNHVKLADLGSMRHVSDVPTNSLVTYYNRPLEVFLGGPYNTSLDMFSFGTFLFRLITKKQLFNIPGSDDINIYYNYRMIHLLCLQCGYPSNEYLKTLNYANQFFTFKENDKPQLKYPIPMVYTPWKAMLLEGCREKGFDNFITCYFIDLISRCLNHQNRITAVAALRHCLFKFDLSFSITSNLSYSSQLTVILYKKKTHLLQVSLANATALKCIHLSGYSFVKCMLQIKLSYITLYEKEIAIWPRSNLAITSNNENNVHVRVLKK
jgi:serine/threonine protein kinase